MLSLPKLLSSEPRRLAAFSILVISFACISPSTAAPPETTKPIEGLRDRSPTVHALVGGKIVVSPEETIENGSLVLRDGVIVAVGAGIEIPPDARRWDVSGKTLYPGFLDAYSEIELESSVPKQTAHWNDLVTPQIHTADHLSADKESRNQLRSQGIAVQLVAPAKGIIKGMSCLVATGDDPVSNSVYRTHVAQHIRLTISRHPHRDTYPNSPMGAFALARQTFYDTQWYDDAQRILRVQPDLPRPEMNASLETLLAYVKDEGLVLINTANERALLTADAFAKEFSLKAAFIGSGREYRRLDAVKRTLRTVIVPVNFPKAPRVDTPEAAMHATLESLLHWELAPGNPARLVNAGVSIAFTTHGLRDSKDFLGQVRIAVKRGLDPEEALRALTITPANLYGVEHRVGMLKAGLDANVIVADGEIFDEQTKVLETWISGKRYEVTHQPIVDIRGKWELESEGPLRGMIFIGGDLAKLAGEVHSSQSDVKQNGKKKKRKQKQTSESEEKIKLESLELDGSHLTGRFLSQQEDRKGVVRLSFIVELDKSGVPVWLGSAVWPSGERESITARRLTPFDPESDEFQTLKAADKTDAEAKEKEKQASTNKTEGEIEQDLAQANFDVNFPLGAFGRIAPPEQPEFVVMRGATIWTCGKQGVIPEGEILLHHGKVSAVGKKVKAPEGAMVINADGKHITPGIIDCHSHIATDGGVNESGQAITAEVRISDFIDSDDISIYRQLAGGVTTSNILHGSANPIGGQNQVLKFRWGALPEDLKFREAPTGVKFALGENVKQSNWGDHHTSRYPQTRMGVDQLIRETLTAAQEYQRHWDTWNREHTGIRPRRDLELEAVAEVLRGERWVHCHSYRQDEILALLRTLDEFGITIGTLQHILEGYKVADEMVKHKAMGSSFSDWWAYKFEVFDAIPFNGALMHEQGVVVSFNSDDAELGRRLNLEAAKAVKYGGVPPEEALKFVTLNPAKQLRIDRYVGSLEKGKHADLVIWSGDPLSTFTRCEQTWIDGRRYFDLEEDLAARKSAEQLRTILVQKILTSGAKMVGIDDPSEDDHNLWPRHDMFCHGHGEEHMQTNSSEGEE